MSNHKYPTIKEALIALLNCSELNEDTVEDETIDAIGNAWAAIQRDDEEMKKMSEG